MSKTIRRYISQLFVSNGDASETELIKKEVDFLHGEIASLNAEINSLRQPKSDKENTGKIFCIGMLKTGTTSMEKVLSDMGFRMGDQGTAEKLLKPCVRRNWAPLIEYCKSADAFQDIPFVLPHVFVVLDATFPNSKFILTVRENEDVWFSSYLKFTKKIISERFQTDQSGKLDIELVRKYDYRYQGYLYDVQKYCFAATKDTMYDPDLYKEKYLSHNKSVLEYFSHCSEKLLLLDLRDKRAKENLCSFLDVENDKKPLPHLNQSS